MDRSLLAAATTGDFPKSIQHLASQDPAVLLGTTPQGNTCLHIACIHGHEGFCKHVLTHNQPIRLLTATNADGETPLLTAVARGLATLASVLLRFCLESLDQQLRETILKQDKRGFNALHHAIFRGHRKLALELIEAEPALSKGVNKRDESPMFIAVTRDYGDVLEKLLQIPDAAHGGAHGCNALHAAVECGNAVMAKRVMEARPGLIRQENKDKHTPMHLAAKANKIDVLTVLLEHDPSLGYFISTDAVGAPLLCIAASQGNVHVARELLRHSPDPPYCDATGSTCLHIAVSFGQADFVRFVVRSPQLQHLINLPDNKGETALELATRIMLASDGGVRQAMMSMVAVLQFHFNNLSIHTEPFTSGMERFLKAAASGHVAEMKHLYLHVKGELLGTTPQGNTCLHIASIHGHKVFCKEALTMNPLIVAAVNSDGETPLLAAVASGHDSVASDLLSCCRKHKLRETILKQDKHGCNALHHAIRCGHRKLALELIEAEPALSHAVNQYGESPMFVAVMRNYEEVFNKLLEIPDSAHGGAQGHNALHAAVKKGNSEIAKKIMETRPALAREEEDTNMNTPLRLAVLWDKIEVLKVLLEHDPSLGYVVSSDDFPLLVCAAYRGHVRVAQELLKHCPDAPYTRTNAWTCLHTAVYYQQMEFVEFILDTPQLRRLINMRNEHGDTALHIAVEKCNPKMVAALLLHKDIDVTVFNKQSWPPNWRLSVATDNAKTLNWWNWTTNREVYNRSNDFDVIVISNEVSMRMLKADPHDAPSIFNLHKEAKNRVIDSSRKNIKSLTQTYTGNTSLVAILIATITFAAAFTLPGGYSSDPGNEGLPIMSRKFAFKAFLISDTLAMCSSLAVAFICVIAKWEDFEFLLYYRSFTKKLMWFAYVATTIAFATGLYNILAPHLLWLAVAICILTSLLPILTKLLGEWPIWRLRFRLGQFRSELLDMV